LQKLDDSLQLIAIFYVPKFKIHCLESSLLLMPKYVVRYGAMRFLGIMQSRGDDVFARGAQVISRTDRGLECSVVLCEATEESTKELKNPTQGQILRAMTPADSVEQSRILAQQRGEFLKCRELVGSSQLEMELVDLEHIFGGERIVVYYLAENRIDFRDLVKQLAGEFQTRIEMRQIGVRDEAKLLADYGDCGKPVCCNTHLNEMPPVSMKMAKLQKATLDPTKISGRCGRLKCCLRYEYDTYESLQQQLPPVGSDVLTQRGRHRVLAHEILAQQLLVETEDHRRMLIPAAEVLTIVNRGPGYGAEGNNPANSGDPNRN
jgi:cell fate regulator YaaT (PSP1 superfamily)